MIIVLSLGTMGGWKNESKRLISKLQQLDQEKEVRYFDTGFCVMTHLEVIESEEYKDITNGMVNKDNTCNDIEYLECYLITSFDKDDNKL